MSREVPAWQGKTDDAAIPARVRARVFERFGGRCALSGRKIGAGEPWQLDHIVPLILGGAHAEANLQPVSVDAHKLKTATDVKAKAKAARCHAKHFGYAARPARKIPSHVDPWGKRRKGAEGRG